MTAPIILSFPFGVLNDQDFQSVNTILYKCIIVVYLVNNLHLENMFCNILITEIT
jgi:hypothetical protein